MRSASLKHEDMKRLCSDQTWSIFGRAMAAVFLISMTQPIILQAKTFYGSTTLSQQVQVDNFDYDTVTGTLIISGSITNLDGLSILTSVRDLEIYNADLLTDISGLTNLSSISGNLILWGNASLSNVDGLSSVTTVPGYLDIVDTSLTNLDGLSSLASAGGRLYITNNRELTDIDGLSSLTSVGDLTFSGYNALTEISGFSNLTTVSGSVLIFGSFPSQTPNSLVSLDLSAVTSVGGNLEIRYNQALAGVAMSSISSVGGLLRIRDNDALTSVDLSSLTSIGGRLDITNNPVLTGLDGFSSLTSIGENFYLQINGMLDNIDGLSSLTTIGNSVYIYNNAVLTNLDGLSSLSTVGGYLTIYRGALANIDGLSSLVQVGSFLTILQSSLVDIDGLSSLTSVGAELEILSNNRLANLDGLSSLTSVGGYLDVSFNPALTRCCGLFPLLSARRGGVEGTINISNNGAGCTEADILSGGSCFVADAIIDIEDLKNEVLELLGEAPSSGLLAKLDEAIKALENENANPAINKLHDFIDQVRAKVNTGALAPDDGQQLIDAANSIIALLESGSAAKMAYSRDTLASPNQFSLMQNEPNPFNPRTTIRFSLPAATKYSLAIYDIAGRLVRRYAGFAAAGQVSVVWDGQDRSGVSVSSGVYFYKLQAGQFSDTKRMLLLK